VWFAALFAGTYYQALCQDRYRLPRARSDAPTCV